MKTNWLKRHAPDIIFGVCLTGMVGGTVLAVSETPKALRSIEEAKLTKGDENLTFWETVKATWKHYIPAAAVTTLSAVGAACVMHGKNKKISALAVACAASEKTVELYKDKIVEVLGEKKAEQVQRSISQEKIDKTPIPTAVNTETTIIYDNWSLRYFNLTPDDVHKAAMRTYSQLMASGDDPDSFATVNDFYINLGVDTQPAGDVYGWNAADKISAEAFDITTGSHLKDGKYPVFAFDFGVAPKTNPQEPRDKRRRYA